MSSLLYGLNDEESIIALWKLLFSPSLRKHFGSDWSLEWSSKLVANFAEGHAAFSNQYNHLAPQVKAASASNSEYSMTNPPWSMVSLDMRLGLVPWVTSAFDRALEVLLSEGSALAKDFGTVVPFAFFLRGGPGDSKETAFRVCAPSQCVRAAAEHWLMRAYLWRPGRYAAHMTSRRNNDGLQFSIHRFTDEDGAESDVFFETTESFGREAEDIQQFLRDSH